METSLSFASGVLAVGILFLAIDVFILGFSTLVLTTFGIALIAVSGLMSLGIIPETTLALLSSSAILGAVITALAWKPLKRFQSNTQEDRPQGDLPGTTFILATDIDANTPTPQPYSGVTWQVISDTALKAGEPALIVKAEVGRLHITQA